MRVTVCLCMCVFANGTQAHRNEREENASPRNSEIDEGLEHIFEHFGNSLGLARRDADKDIYICTALEMLAS